MVLSLVVRTVVYIIVGRDLAVGVAVVVDIGEVVVAAVVPVSAVVFDIGVVIATAIDPGAAVVFDLSLIATHT